MIEDLKAYCITYIVTLWVILFRANSKKIQNWKQKLIIRNEISSAEISKLLNCWLPYINHYLASFFVLFKHRYLSFVNLSMFLHHVAIFWLERLYILPKFQRPTLNVHVLLCKTGIYSWILSEKVSLMYENSFSIPVLCNLKYISQLVY